MVQTGAQRACGPQLRTLLRAALLQSNHIVAAADPVLEREGELPPSRIVRVVK